MRSGPILLVSCLLSDLAYLMAMYTVQRFGALVAGLLCRWDALGEVCEEELSLPPRSIPAALCGTFAPYLSPRQVAGAAR